MTDDPDDPLLRPASDAGWDDEPVKPETAQLEAARLEAAKLEAARLEAARLEAARLEAAAHASPPTAPPEMRVVPEATIVVTDEVTAPITDVTAATDTVTAVTVADTPITDAPITDTPITDTPITDTPITDTPITDAPITDTPITDTPITDTPITDAPITDAATPTADTPTTTATPAAGATSTPTSPKLTVDEPLLPATYDANALRAAVGASPLTTTATRHKRRPADDDIDATGDLAEPRSRKATAYTILGIVAGLGIIALVVLGRLNSDRYLLACEAERAVPQHGRSFPPWGVRELGGDTWRPLKITAETRCQPHETEDPTTLQRLYLAMVLEQTTAILSAREVTRVDEAELLLKQALLLTRPPERESAALATERTERHKEVQRMLGDVAYWRASARLRDAAAQLAEAAKQFERAAAQHPRHVTDAPAWAQYAQRLAQELRAGPAGRARPAGPSAPASAPVPGATALTPDVAGAAAPGTPSVPPSASELPGIPPGVALPVEPTAPLGSEQPVTPAPDAGTPTGGVLL